ncbi:MAG: DNA-formamidopyrimidine glycosylase [Methanobacteriota archaeon]|nr:MAG: DNA-formamidopyrimidine glycosylase [Euryarchaeota archaeon]HIG20737.1 bifunctional DNA-formamidopyrimidine glycosylase/DNA-(apurinic or apyrimidinic site) lyase [Candidatus Poseidoniales archaeon]
MPELPEVETVRKGLTKYLQGGTISSVVLRREGLRFPFPKDMSNRLINRRIEEIKRRAKYLLIRLDDDSTWLVHLGMTGKFTLFANESEFEEIGKHDHVIMRMQNGAIAVYNDPRRFGVMDLIEAGGEQNHRLLARIGCEPLSEKFNAKSLSKSIENKKSPIKTVLLDQRVVAGLGNIYVCEILNRAGVSPRRTASSVASSVGRTGSRCERIVEQTKQVLREAIAAGGSTISDFAAVDGDLGYFAHSFRVYGREGEACLTDSCNGTVKRIAQGGRSTFFCSKCQR